MSAVIKILLFAILFYFILGWVKSLFVASNKRNNTQPNVRIFKKGDVEKSSVDIKDAETVEFEEIKEDN